MIRLDELKMMYEAQLHSLQSGIKTWLRECGTGDTSLFGEKHQKVGEESTWISVLALASILVDKGTISEDLCELDPAVAREAISKCQVVNGALLQILIEKGIFTEVEYMEVLVQFLSREVQSYEDKLSAKQQAILTSKTLGGKMRVKLR